MLQNAHILSLLVMSLIITQCSQPTANKEANQAIDPLPSWNKGTTKAAIFDFVQTVTDSTSKDFVLPTERIAVFDNDGTLWSERPVYFQLYFILDRIKTLAPDHPEWKEQQPFKAVLENDQKAIFASGEHGLVQLAMAAQSGMTTTEFEEIVKDWIGTARHPDTGMLFTEMVFEPMLEVLNYFRDHGFKTYIVSGGGIEFMRPWTQKIYGIPAEQVIGSSSKTEFELVDGIAQLRRLPALDFIDDKEGKPIAINKFIGKRPIAAFGNSDGDLQMLQWTDAEKGKKLNVYIHHTDSVREWAYDRESPIGRLDNGLDEAVRKGWIIVDMKNDWLNVYKVQ